MPTPSVLERFTAGTNNGYQRQKVKLQLKLPVNSRNKTQQTVRKSVPNKTVAQKSSQLPENVDCMSRNSIKTAVHDVQSNHGTEFGPNIMSEMRLASPGPDSIRTKKTKGIELTWHKETINNQQHPNLYLQVTWENYNLAKK